EYLHRLFDGVGEDNRAIRPAHQAANRAGTEVKRLRTVMETIPTTSNRVEESVAQLRTQLHELRSQLADRDTQLAALAKSVAHCRNPPPALGRRTAGFRDRLPRPPAGLSVALSIVAVVVFGLVLGIVLSDPSSLELSLRSRVPPS